MQHDHARAAQNVARAAQSVARAAQSVARAARTHREDDLRKLCKVRGEGSSSVTLGGVGEIVTITCDLVIALPHISFSHVTAPDLAEHVFTIVVE